MEQEIIRIDLNGVNCYLSCNNGEFILFDTGGHLFFDKDFNNRRDDIDRELEKYGCTADNLKLIVLTHGDNDHVANAAYLREKYHTRIAMHKDDISLINNPSVEVLMENCRYRSLGYRILSFFIKGLLKKIIIKTKDDFESFQPDELIDESFDLSNYGLEADIIHLPGHTRGSIGILTKRGDFIAGDIFANNGKPVIAPNAMDFKQLKGSIEKLKTLDIKTIYPGHGEPFSCEWKI